MRIYKVTYSKKYYRGETCVFYDQIMTDVQIHKFFFQSDSYVMIKCELQDYDIRELDSVSYDMDEQS